MAQPELFAPAVVVLVELITGFFGRAITLPEKKAAIIAEAGVPVLMKQLPKASSKYAEEINLLMVLFLVVGGEWSKDK